jgi:acyl-CoA thioester hydrolase
MNTGDWKFILASTKCDFISQGYFNQLLTIKSYISRIGTKSFQLDHDIIDTKTEQLIAKGNAIMVHFDFDLQKSEPLPELLIEHLNQHLIQA